MGLFDKNYEKSAMNLYEEIKPYLKQKDGMKHVVMVKIKSKVTTDEIEYDKKYMILINNIIESMQCEGYEIIDIKIDNTQLSWTGAFSNCSLRTLIIYK